MIGVSDQGKIQKLLACMPRTNVSAKSISDRLLVVRPSATALGVGRLGEIILLFSGELGFAQDRSRLVLDNW